LQAGRASELGGRAREARGLEVERLGRRRGPGALGRGLVRVRAARERVEVLQDLGLVQLVAHAAAPGRGYLDQAADALVLEPEGGLGHQLLEAAGAVEAFVALVQIPPLEGVGGGVLAERAVELVESGGHAQDMQGR